MPFFRRLLHLFGIARVPDTAEDLEQEIQDLIEDGEELGLISRQEGMMINSIFEFRDTLAKEIMTPQADVVSAPASATVEELIAIITEKGFTRIPIYDDSPDNITGILHAKDLLPCCTGACRPGLKAGDLTNPALFVLESHKIGRLLRDFKSKKIHMAIVTDEFGGVRGVVTLEDVLEEIVGEIEDEYDKDDVRWRVMDKNTVLTDAKVDIEEVETFFGVNLPDGPYESIGGYVIHALGRMPKAGDVVETSGLRLRVLAATKRRITSLKIKRAQQGGP